MNQLKAGAALSYILIGLNTIIGLVYTPFMLRMMGQNEYGLYSLAAAVISYLTVLDLGFGNAVVRYTARYKAENKTEEQSDLFGMFLIIYSIIALITLLIGAFLYNNTSLLFGNTMTDNELGKVRIMIVIMIFNLAFTFPFSLFSAIITANERFVFLKILNIIRTILNPIIMIIMLYAGYRAVGMVVITTIFNVITLLIHAWYCFQKLHIKIRFGRFRWDFFREVSIYSFWIFLNAVMDRIYWSTGQFVLGIYRGTSAVAVYAVAIQLQQLYMNFSTAISSVFLPKVTAISMQEKSMKLLSRLFIKVGRIQYLVMALVLSGFIVFGSPFIELWAGVDYQQAYYITLLFFISLLTPLIQNLGITILQAQNKMKFRSVCYVVIAIGCLFLSIPLAKKYGGIGCAIAVSGALFLGQGLVMNWYYWKKIEIEIPRFWLEIFKMSKTPVVFTVLGYFLVKQIEITGFIHLLVLISVFLLFYIGSCWFFDMNKSEKELLSTPFKRLISKNDQYKRK